MFCSYCGAEIRDDSAFCYKCGKPTDHPDAHAVHGGAENVSARFGQPTPQPVQLDHNVTISCSSAHKKAYTEVQAGGRTIKIFSGQSAKLLLPAGNNKIRFFTRRYGMTWVKTKDRYERDLFVEPGRVYQIAVTIGQAANRIDISG